MIFFKLFKSLKMHLSHFFQRSFVVVFPFLFGCVFNCVNVSQPVWFSCSPCDPSTDRHHIIIIHRIGNRHQQMGTKMMPNRHNRQTHKMHKNWMKNGKAMNEITEGISGGNGGSGRSSTFHYNYMVQSYQMQPLLTPLFAFYNQLLSIQLTQKRLWIDSRRHKRTRKKKKGAHYLLLFITDYEDVCFRNFKHISLK